MPPSRFVVGAYSDLCEAFALAVNLGVLGSLFLLLRKAWAVPTLILSLLFVVAQMARAGLTGPLFALLLIPAVVGHALCAVGSLICLIRPVQLPPVCQRPSQAHGAGKNMIGTALIDPVGMLLS